MKTTVAKIWMLIGWLGFCTQSAVATDLPEPPTPPHIAVLPLVCEHDPAYGIFLADRLVVELMQYREMPALKTRWFELVEPDTVETSVITAALSTRQALPGEVLAGLKKATEADAVLLGAIVQAGIQEVHLRLIDTTTGEIIWEGKTKDDTKWMWTRAQGEVGEFALSNFLHQLEFPLEERHPPIIRASELPSKVTLRPFYTTHRAVVTIFEKLIREDINHAGLFKIKEAGLASGMRLNAVTRRIAHEQANVDAVLCGSLLGLGIDNTINHTALTLRLVAVPSGKILWASSASGKRVWRKDDFDMMAQPVSANIIANLAQARSGALHETLAFSSTPQNGPEWVQRGMIYLARGLLPEAEEAFTKALTFPESEIFANDGLGRVFARRPARRNQAVAFFKRTIELDPTSAERHHRLAEVYRDMENQFAITTAQHAIELDPTFSPPYRLIANWHAKEYWYNNTNDNETAIKYYTEYLKREPDDIKTALSCGKILLNMNHLKRIETLILPILQKHPEATDLLPIIGQWASMQEKYDESAKYWTQYLSRTSPLDLHHYESPEVLMNDAEKKEYAALGESAKPGYLKRLWQRLDLDITTAVNERQLEHYRRVWFARHTFSELTYPWDRRGEVYIRYGDPDHRARANRVPTNLSNAVQQVKERLYSELYDEPAQESLVGTVFPVRSSRAMQADQAGLMGARTQYGGEVYINPIGGAATITYPNGDIETIPGFMSFDGSPEHVSIMYEAAQAQIAQHDSQMGSINAESHILGDAFMPVTSGADHSDVIWESWVYVSIGGGIEITFTDELGAGNYDFAPMPMRLPPGMRSISRIQEHAPETTYARTVQETPEQHRPWWHTKPFVFHYQPTDFQGKENNTLFEVAFGVPSDAPKQSTKKVELAFAITDTLRGRIYRQSKEVDWDSDIPPNSLLVDVLGSDVRPGGYLLNIKAQNASANQISLLQQTIDVEPYDTTHVQISDVVLASKIYEDEMDSPFRKEGLQVIPLPTHQFLVGQSLGTYFEVYNLTKDSFGQAHYKVKFQIHSLEQKTGLKQIFKGPDPNPEIQLTLEQIASQSKEQVYQFFDLKNTKFGKNRLTIEIQDLQSGQITLKSVEFQYGQ